MASVKFFKNAPAATYRENSTGDNAASTSSAVPLLDQADINIGQDPPPYSDNEDEPTSTLVRGTLDEVIEERVSEDRKGSTITRISPTLSVDPVALKEFILQQAAICPEPSIRIRGTHTVTTRETNGQKKRQEVEDFDIKIDVTDTISRRSLSPNSSIPMREWMKLQIVQNGIKAYRGGRTRSKAKGYKADLETSHEIPSLDEFCHLFCASSAKLKSFTLNRTVTQRSEDILLNQISSFIRATNYRGHIHITFPVYSRSVTVVSPHPLNRLRHNPWIWWACVLLQLWIITWPLLWFMTRRWEVVEAQWPYKIWVEVPPQDSPVGRGSEGFGDAAWRNGRWAYVRESEEDWCKRWRRGIMCAVEGRTKGWITEALGDAVEARLRDMEVENGARKIVNARAQLGQTGNAGGFVGGIVGLARSFSGVTDQIDESRGWGRDC